MSNALEVTFLGTGTSHGIPMIGCDCEVCTSADPHDKRHRTCASVRLPDGRVLLIDTPPEFRIEAITHNLDRVDAVLLTHAHADHILGMDDLRRYNNMNGGTIDCYANADTLAMVRTIFGYAERPYVNPDRPSLAFHEIESPTEVAGVTVTPIPLRHASRTINGYRVGRFAYCTDCSEIPETSWPLLEGLDTLVLGALRYAPHPGHFTLDQALAAVKRLQPRQAYFTHIAHQLSHAAVNAELPDGVALAHDGLRVAVHCA